MTGVQNAAQLRSWFFIKKLNISNKSSIYWQIKIYQCILLSYSMLIRIFFFIFQCSYMHDWSVTFRNITIYCGTMWCKNVTICILELKNGLQYWLHLIGSDLINPKNEMACSSLSCCLKMLTCLKISLCEDVYTLLKRGSHISSKYIYFKNSVNLVLSIQM